MLKFPKMGRIMSILGNLSLSCWENTMRVELVATTNSDSQTLGELPLVVGEQAAGNMPASTPTLGKCRCLIAQVEDQLTVWDLGTGEGTLSTAPGNDRLSQAGRQAAVGGNEFAVRCERGNRATYMFGVRS